ncbi:cyclic nucleotide-binding domain-containing protein [Synechococcus sp. RSCCF101]|uniref:cyclic nucleotide-binding domain-containing protein n=1 Tax=Synechococcus sp. RSCCF101 TaxID=2511069 RepID=UPI0012464047|nr:cyclic nucleotide-binding domain-containing protein [Synechococcus sp. RSCCF101]QEY32070.1 cyclic nucleotide-binding domain-containing protein [Synechococcus sp. RSCCF101]
MAAVLAQIASQPFLAGVVSACSMPLGAATGLLWRPRNRTSAVLIAFGAGALLSALVIDLVGSAQAKGHLLELGVGSVAGSLFYTLVNALVNGSGGFLRKPATMLSHLSAESARLRRRRVRQLAAVDLFRGLPISDLQDLAACVQVAAYSERHTLFRSNDPGESLYLVLEGAVHLLDPGRDDGLYASVGPFGSVGRLAFLTGTPHRMAAVCASEAQLAILSRPDFERLLQESLSFSRHIAARLHHPELLSYLEEREQLPRQQAEAWVAAARQALMATRHLPDAVTIDRHIAAFQAQARHIGKFPVFANLPEDDLEQVADRLVYGRFDDGHAFFQAGEEAERLFLLERGEVELLDPRQPRRRPRLIRGGEALGELSFVTGVDHTVTAVARTTGSAWALRREDFDHLLERSAALDEAVRLFLSDERVRTYLQGKQGFTVDLSERWVNRALHEMHRGHLLPSASVVLDEVNSRGSAPLAIWIGLLMDGIPEALTIGAHVIAAPLSSSLLLGLFIANYPEALSSSHGMRQQGFPPFMILGMWAGLALLTGVLAALGAAVFQGVSDRWVSLIGAMAAGAMLTVISETMLPESYAKGGSVVGLSTILGFLAIIYVNGLNASPHGAG